MHAAAEKQRSYFRHKRRLRRSVYLHSVCSFLTPATRPLFFNDKCLRFGEREESNRGSAVSCLGALCICAANSDAASCFPPRGTRHRPVVTQHYTAWKIIISSPAARPGSHARDERCCGTRMPMAASLPLPRQK